MARYSVIRRANLLKNALTNLELFDKQDLATRQANYAIAAAIGNGKRVNRASRMVFIRPFGGSGKLFYQVKSLALAADTPPAGAKTENDAALITKVISATTNYFSVALTAAQILSSEVTPGKRLKFAKVRCTERSEVPVPAVSRITKLEYSKHISNTISSPYGDADTSETETAARLFILNSLTTAAATAGHKRSIGFSPQDIM